ncbi:hypothetical protein VJ923_07300 [Adlercreutzia sp. R25]|uniref:hypothetical protein n=1 Tax=Adlercreutzia shanghongiae TaxID=3111773 RepID=UPI002DBAE08E|nr:hypothetical protein [Adlercreutzia sp. R25]MEC4272960.1 hypothetical protein [Adlercreutzia sp. R25]
MIDIETELYDELARSVLAEFPGAYVAGQHEISPPRFPAVFIEQTFSSELDACRDSSGEENANAVIWTVNVYSNSQSGARDQCKRILAIIDARLRRHNMKRLTARPIDNAADPTVYRYVGRFTGLVDKNGTTYWR